MGLFKDFLALRGLKKTGKKVELVARAFGAYELGIPKTFTQEQILDTIKNEYAKRLETNCIKSDPNLLGDEFWKDNVVLWPHVDDGKLFRYILHVKAVDVEYIGRYKDEKAYSYWMSGFVDTVYVAECPIDKDMVFLKGKVSPSQRINDEWHDVWICVNRKENCKIVTSWCTCITGTAEACSHVIAVLYKVNYAYNKQYVSPACTSIPQGWNHGTKREVKPSKLADLTFRKDKKSKKASKRNPLKNPSVDQTLRKEFDPRKPDDRTMTNDRVSLLMNNIVLAIPTAWVWLSIEHGSNDILPLPLTKKAVEFMSADDRTNKPLEEVVPLFIQELWKRVGIIRNSENSRSENP